MAEPPAILDEISAILERRFAAVEGRASNGARGFFVREFRDGDADGTFESLAGPFETLEAAATAARRYQAKLILKAVAEGTYG